MGSKTMEVTGQLEEMTDHSALFRTRSASARSTEPRSRCTRAAVDRRRGPGGAREQRRQRPLGRAARRVVPVGGQGAEVLRQTQVAWQDCANYAVSVDDGGNSYYAGNWTTSPSNDTMVTQVHDAARRRRVGMSACPVAGVERDVEVWACSYTGSTRSGDHREPDGRQRRQSSAFNRGAATNSSLALSSIIDVQDSRPAGRRKRGEVRTRG